MQMVIYARMVAAAVALCALTAGCAARPLETGTAVPQDDPAAAAPTATDSTRPPPGKYRFVADLCKKIDFAPIEEILPLAGEMTERHRESVPYSSAGCHSVNEPRDATITSGTTDVAVEWLPTARIAGQTFERRARGFSAKAEQAERIQGWEQAVLGTGNRINDTAAALLLQDGNMIVEVRFTQTIGRSVDRAAPAVRRVAESVTTLAVA